MKCFLVVIAMLGFGARTANAASAGSEAKQKVMGSISITNLSGIDFGIASPGDGPKTVAPDQRETPENASFFVRGEAHAMYYIHLPSDGMVEMATGSGAARNKKIPVNLFRSYPDRFGVLDQSGKQTIYIGATRDRLQQDQQPGDYVGYFTVTVVY